MNANNKVSEQKDPWYLTIGKKLTGSANKQLNEVNHKKNVKVSSVKTRKLKSEQIKPVVVKKDRVISRRKRTKQYKRLCLNCQQIFEASRKDAKYCSGSCRKTASVNGDNLIYYGNAADQFYKKLMLKLLEEILGCNNSRVSLWRINHFIGWIDIGDDLFVEYLSTYNQLKNMIQHEVYRFLTELYNENANGNSNSIWFQIPQDYLIRWQEKVDQLNSNKVEGNIEGNITYYHR
jgi:hypothetical protein